MSRFVETPTADVCLVLEGTYPYVRGGVSSWVYQIISALPETTFSLVFLGGRREAYTEKKYPLPENVVALEEIYLMEPPKRRRVRRFRGLRAAFGEAARLHDTLRSNESSANLGALAGVLARFGTAEGIQAEDFLYSPHSWRQICEQYRKHSTEPSFVDYFWTVRSMHEPLFHLARAAQRLPPAGMYHSVSTGYAGFLALLLHRRHEVPFVLTEHGIYTKERKIDLTQATWIKERVGMFESTIDGDVSYIRKMWIRFFEGLGRLAYDAADPIISLYEGNRQRQIADGADADRCFVVPNGIDIDTFRPLREKQTAAPPPVLGFIGRVVPIKDVKTFIRCMRTVCTRLPEAEGWIVGPDDEDEEYAQECRDLVTSLALEDNVKFLGFKKVRDILPQLGAVVLTSISEALPLVILEGFASGVPALVTDVGSCRELIEGSEPEDRALGAAGAVVPIAEPEAMAHEALRLLTSPEEWQTARAVAIQRVERYYTLEQMMDSYSSMYAEALETTWQE